MIQEVKSSEEREITVGGPNLAVARDYASIWRSAEKVGWLRKQNARTERRRRAHEQ